MAIRVRKGVLEAFNEMITKAIERFLDVQAPPPGGGGKGRGALGGLNNGMRAGAGMAAVDKAMGGNNGGPKPRDSKTPGGGPSGQGGPPNAGGTEQPMLIDGGRTRGGSGGPGGPDGGDEGSSSGGSPMGGPAHAAGGRSRSDQQTASGLRRQGGLSRLGTTLKSPSGRSAVRGAMVGASRGGLPGAVGGAVGGALTSKSIGRGNGGPKSLGGRKSTSAASSGRGQPGAVPKKLSRGGRTGNVVAGATKGAITTGKFGPQAAAAGAAAGGIKGGKGGGGKSSSNPTTATTPSSSNSLPTRREAVNAAGGDHKVSQRASAKGISQREYEHRLLGPFRSDESSRPVSETARPAPQPTKQVRPAPRQRDALNPTPTPPRRRPKPSAQG